jgi:DNA-binding protein H-NS
MASTNKQNLSKMELAELLQLRDEIETALNGKIAMERKELEAKMAELTVLERNRSPRSNGSHPPASKSTRSAARKSHPLKGKKAKPMYKGPKGETWAGRGLPPRWLTALEKAGKKREQYLVNKSK